MGCKQSFLECGNRLSSHAGTPSAALNPRGLYSLAIMGLENPTIANHLSSQQLTERTMGAVITEASNKRDELNQISNAQRAYGYEGGDYKVGNELINKPYLSMPNHTFRAFVQAGYGQKVSDKKANDQLEKAGIVRQGTLTRKGANMFAALQQTQRRVGEIQMALTAYCGKHVSLNGVLPPTDMPGAKALFAYGKKLQGLLSDNPRTRQEAFRDPSPLLEDSQVDALLEIGIQGMSMRQTNPAVYERWKQIKTEGILQ